MINSMYSLDHRLAELRPSESQQRNARFLRDAAASAGPVARSATSRNPFAGHDFRLLWSGEPVQWNVDLTMLAAGLGMTVVALVGVASKSVRNLGLEPAADASAAAADGAEGDDGADDVAGTATAATAA